MDTKQKETIQNVKDIANSIKESELLCTTSNILFCYENNRLDDEDLYRLSRDILSLVSDVIILRDEINRV
ncbi:MAG: hypothetical protein IKV17_07865 [Bacteroidaceae bacterium]|jgi:hypothetical protein|nr:hypothetical protein [Bacteroidaceae bacterium]